MKSPVRAMEGPVRYGFPPPMSREWTTKEIDDELRNNGFTKNFAERGFFVEKLIGATMEISPNVARGHFTINDEATDQNGQLLRGLVDYLAEGIGSAAGAAASESKRVVGIELNRNYLRPAYLGQEVTVIAKPLRKGSNTQVWEIKFEAENTKKPTTESNANAGEKLLIAVSRLTLMVQTQEEMEKLAIQSKL